MAATQPDAPKCALHDEVIQRLENSLARIERTIADHCGPGGDHVTRREFEAMEKHLDTLATQVQTTVDSVTGLKTWVEGLKGRMVWGERIAAVIVGIVLAFFLNAALAHIWPAAESALNAAAGH